MSTITDSRVAKKFVQIEKSAHDRGIHFDMSLKRIRRLLETKTCFFTGKVLVHSDGNPNQLTFDRIDNSKGYTDENVVACTSEFNQLKGKLSINDIVLLHKGLKKKGLI